MKATITIISVLILSVVIYVLVKLNVAPAFSLENVDYLAKKGTFRFGGIDNTFDLKGGGTYGPGSSWTKWSLTVRPGSVANTVVFDLYKAGKFIKTLETVNFNR